MRTRPVRDAKIDVLSRLPLFEGLTTAELGELSAAADIVTLPRFRNIAHQGARGEVVFVIIDGMVQVKKNGRVLAYLEDGDVVGELAVLDRMPRSATITTVVETELLAIDRRHLGPVLERHPDVAERLHRVAGVRRAA